MPVAPALRKYSITYPQCILDKEHAGEILRQFADARCVVVAHEKHADGHDHLHAYMEFRSRARRGTALFDIQGSHGNVQGCRNTKDWLKYITKFDKKPYSWGLDIEAALAKKNAHLSVAKAAEMSYDELRTKVRPEQLQRTLAGIQLDKLMTSEVSDLPGPCGIWIQGEPGVGKSHDIREYCKLAGKPYYDKPHNKWWDGYSGEEIVILDDIHEDQKSWITPFLKTWADAYAFKGETKGGTMQIRPKHIIVTSNFGPEDFADHDIDKQAIRRRFEYFYIMKYNETFDALLKVIGPIIIPPTPEEEATTNNLSGLTEPSDLPIIEDPPGLADLD